MDSNISDLLGGVLSNPEMMSKVKTLMPLVSQMLKTDEPPAIAPPPAQVNNQPAGDAAPHNNILADANVAAAVQNLIAALNAANNQPAQEAAPVFAQQQPPEIQAPPPESVNIEKTLDTLKNITAVASPENDHRAKLLLSLKPFLGESRRTKIDTAIKYINAAKIFKSFGKNGFV